MRKKRPIRFITFEGPEGSGKSTQAKMLYNYLKKKGLDVVYLREPGGTKIGEKIRDILLNPKNEEMDKLCELLLYMASRAQLVKEKLSYYLKRKKIVICDRFLDATLAYQGYGSGISIHLIKSLGKIVTQNIKPDLTILLDTPTKRGLSRAGRYKDRIEKKDILYHYRVRKGYRKLAQMYPKRIKLIYIDKLSALKIHKKVCEIIDKYICLKNSKDC